MKLWIISLNLYILKNTNRLLCIATYSRFGVGDNERADAYDLESVKKISIRECNFLFQLLCNYSNEQEIQITL